MNFGHAYPWQVAARVMQVPLTCRLRRSFDPARLRQDVERALSSHPSTENHPSYHSGGWAGVGLMTANGKPEEIGAFAGDFTKTKAFRSTPYLERLVDELECEKQRVRIMQLTADANIFWHRDHELDRDVVRVHIPVVTNRGVLMQICHEDCRWQPGTLWFGDFAFPHRLRNTSRETRIHIVLDLVANDFVRKLFPPQFESARGARERARRICGGLYAAYNAPTRAQSLLRDRMQRRKSWQTGLETR
jgi:hypothetical protein